MAGKRRREKKPLEKCGVCGGGEFRGPEVWGMGHASRDCKIYVDELRYVSGQVEREALSRGLDLKLVPIVSGKKRQEAVNQLKLALRNLDDPATAHLHISAALIAIGVPEDEVLKEAKDVSAEKANQELQG